MELKLNKQVKSAKINEALCIEDARTYELGNMALGEGRRVIERMAVPHLSESYKKFASACDTIEEYTLCMHISLTFITKYGSLGSDETITN